MAISQFHFQTDFLKRNSIAESGVTNLEEAIKQTATDWSRYCEKWLGRNVIEIRYEHLVHETEDTLTFILHNLKQMIDEELLKDVVQRHNVKYSRETYSQVFMHNTTVRNGRVGDWRDAFADDDKTAFKAIAGDTLIKLGYERDHSW